MKLNTRFIFILLGPKDHLAACAEMTRCMASLFTDEVKFRIINFVKKNNNSFIILFLLCVCYVFVRLFTVALWSPAGKGLTSWLSFVMPNCEFVTFPLVSWVRCGT